MQSNFSRVYVTICTLAPLRSQWFTVAMLEDWRVRMRVCELNFNLVNYSLVCDKIGFRNYYSVYQFIIAALESVFTVTCRFSEQQSALLELICSWRSHYILLMASP